SDQYGQLDHLPLAEMAANIGKRSVRYLAAAGHLIGKGKSGALPLIEKSRRLPIGERIAFWRRQTFRLGEPRHVLSDHIFASIEERNPDDQQLAQAPLDLRLPAHGVEMFEPGPGEARRVQQKLVDVQQLAAT